MRILILVLLMSGCAIIKDKDQALIKFEAGTTGMLGWAAGVNVKFEMGVKNTEEARDEDTAVDDLLAGE